MKEAKYTETSSTSMTERIPKDEKGNPVYEQAESADVAWDAIMEQTGGDEEMATKVVTEMVTYKKAELAKREKGKSKGGATIAEKIAAKKERKAAIEEAKKAVDAWESIARVTENRKRAEEAERVRVAKEKAEALKAEQDKQKAEKAEADRLEREALNGVPDMVDDTPENARARGYRRVNGHKVDRQEPLKPVKGKNIEVKFADGVMPKGNVAVIEAEELQPSNMQGAVNPAHFIPDAQPKNRKGQASVDASRKIAGNIRPEEITSSVTAYTGAPTVNSRGEVIQGNNRGDALREMWATEAEQAQKYKQYLKDHADEFGVSAEDIDRMERPVLVNMLDVEDAEAVKLGQYVAQDTESAGIERIKPNTVTKMGDNVKSFANILLRGEEDDSMSALLDKNGNDVLTWLNKKGYITPTQYSSAFDSKGNISAEAKNDLKGILYQSIFKGGSTQLQEMFNVLPAKAQKAILSTAYRDYDSPDSEKMIKDIQDSVSAFYYMMSNPKFAEATNYKDALLAAESWKNQYNYDDVSGESYLPSERYSNFALLLATMYKGESQKMIQGTFNKLFDLIQGKVEANLFEGGDKTLHTLADAIKETLNIDYNGKKGSVALGSDTATSSERRRGGNGDVASGERGKSGIRETDNPRGTESGSGERIDKQGNPIDSGGKLITEKVKSIAELTDEDFENPTRNVELPKIPENVDNAIGANGKPVVIKKNVFEKNAENHVFSSEQSRVILNNALYNTDLVGRTQPGKRPKHWVAIQLDKDSPITVLEVNETKDNVEVVGWYTLDDRNLQRIKRQADREGGELLMLSSKDKVESLSTPSNNLPSADKDTDKKENSNELGEKIAKAEAETEQNPTEAQKETGNYKKGHVQVGTFDITIENPKGSERKGTDANGKEWSVKMQNTYGYIRGTEGVDGDHIDVFLADDIDGWNGRKVFVVDQTNTDGSFDEHKVMLGFNNIEDAEDAYYDNYSNGWKESHPKNKITGVNLEDFEKWIESSHRKTKAFAEYKGVAPQEAPLPTEGGVKDAKVESGASGKNAEPGQNLEDFGEEIAGARKDLIKQLAKSLGDATEEALVSLPLSKVVKLPTVGKLVKDGVIRESEASEINSLISLIRNRQKPKGQKRSDIRAIGEWAKTQADLIKTMKTLVELSPEERAKALSLLFENKPVNKKSEDEYREQWKEWNPNRVVGNQYTPNPLYVEAEVLKRLGYDLTHDIDKSHKLYVIKASGSGNSLELRDTKGHLVQSFANLDDAINTIVKLNKIARGDGDVSYSKDDFTVRGADKETVKTGEYYVAYMKTNKSWTPTFEDFGKDNVAAEEFAKKKNGKVYERTRAAATSWQVAVTDPLTKEVYMLEGKKYSDRESAVEAIESEYETFNEMANDLISKEYNKGKEATKRSYFNIYQEYTGSKGRVYTIRYEYGPAKHPTAGGPIIKEFTKIEEAQKYLNEHSEELEKMHQKYADKVKAFTYFDDNVKVARKGEDYRNGKDVTPERFTDEFGFRGVQFGNWTNAKDRTAALNGAYDALRDLAKALNVSPRALSLNGELGLAFGARGSGSALAHYEPTEVVINLTKTKGVGSLAHEWWHAMDNYFARQSKVPQGFATDGNAPLMRQELREIFANLKRDIDKSEYGKRSKQRGTYWGSTIEETARLFAELVNDRLQANGDVNAYLSRGLTQEELDRYKQNNYWWYKFAHEGEDGFMSFEEFAKTAEALNGLPYPIKEETTVLGKHIEKLFDVIETSTDDKGNVLMYQKADGEFKGVPDAKDMAARDAVVDLMNDVGIDTSIDEQEGQRVLELAEIQNDAPVAETSLGTWTANEDASSSVHGQLQGTKLKYEVGSNNDFNNLKQRITDKGQLGAHEFLYEIAKIFGFDKFEFKKSYYSDLGNGNDLRIANHYGNAENYKGKKNEDNDHKGFVIKLSPAYFKSAENIKYKEFVYFPDLLTKEKQIAIVEGLKHFAESGDFSKMPKPDMIHPKEQRGYHGGGADFDRFDLSHVGEGEGAQAHGHGVYIAESEGTSRGYATRTSDIEYIGKDKRELSDNKSGVIKDVIQQMRFGATFDEAVSHLNKLFRNPYEPSYKLRREALSGLKESDFTKRQLYTVEYPDNNGENYLEERGTLTKGQRERIIAQAEKEDWGDVDLYGDRMSVRKYFERHGDVQGEDIYKALGRLHTDKQVSEFLNRAGFTGIHYDGRQDGSCYVIFNDNDVKIKEHVKFFRGKNGEVLGFTVGGKVYIDPKYGTAETPIHEYTHLWADMIRRVNPKAWGDIVGLMKGEKELWNYVEKKYPELKGNDDAMAEEVLSYYSGRRGAERLRAEMDSVAKDENRSVIEKATAISALGRIKEALKKFWKGVADLFHIRFTSAEEVADRVMADMVNGVDPRKVESDRQAPRPPKGGEAVKAESGELKTSLGDSRESFAERQKKAEENKGTVMPRLAEKEVEIVNGEKEHGFNSFNDAKEWAKDNIVRTYNNKETGGKGEISVSNNAVSKFLSESAIDKSEDKDVHLSVLKVLPDVIKNSIEAEEHPDYKKGDDKKRNVENGANKDVLVHRLYGAVDIDGKIYRVKVTMKEDGVSDVPSKPHSYEATKIELLEGTLAKPIRNGLDPNTNNSIMGANLLKGVEKSYENGKYLLDESKKSNIRYMFAGEKGATINSQRADNKDEEENSELMKKEMEEKEAKYAEMDNSIEASQELDSAEEDDEDLFREGEELEAINETFNEELQQQIDGTQEIGHIYQIGEPSAILRSTGIPSLPIQLKASKLLEKATEFGHDYDLSDVKNLIKAIHNPLAIFKYGDKRKAQNIVIELQSNGKNFVVGLSLNPIVGGKYLEINSIRNVFPKDNAEWLNWISEDKSLYIDKKRVQNLIDQQRTNLADVEYLDLNSIANVVKDFENPTIESNNYREAEGVGYTDDEISYHNDAVSKMYGESVRSPKSRREFAERERGRMAERVLSLAKKLHLDNVEVVNDSSSLTGKKKKAKGFYTKSTGKITIVIPNHLSVEDAVKTLLHEAVAHYGLRKLFGKHFDTFLDNVYRTADEDIRRKIVAMAAKNKWDFRKATEEYLAGLAEETEFRDSNTSWWGKIKRLFMDMLHKVGFEGFDGVTIGDNELRYILWRSYANLAEPGRYRSILGEAEDVAKQYELGVGNYEPASIEGREVAEKEEVDASSAISEAISEYKKRYRTRDTIVIPENLDAKFLKDNFDIKDEEIEDAIKLLNEKKDIAGYSTDINKILIFTKNFNSNESFESTLFHENIHAVLSNIYGTEFGNRKIANAFYDNDNRDVSKRNKERLHNYYGSEKEKEEFFTYSLEKAMERGDFSRIDKYLPKEFAKELEFILKQINYDRGKESIRRVGTRRFSDNRNTTQWRESTSMWNRNSGNGEIRGDDKKGSSEKGRRSEEASEVDDELYRDGDPEERNRVSVRDSYEKEIASSLYQFQESMQDSMLGLKALMGKIEKATGRKAADFENAYISENIMSSKNRAEADVYTNMLMKPLIQAISDLQKQGASREEINDYMMAKHGLERNVVMAERDADNSNRNSDYLIYY